MYALSLHSLLYLLAAQPLDTSILVFPFDPAGMSSASLYCSSIRPIFFRQDCRKRCVNQRTLFSFSFSVRITLMKHLPGTQQL